jgi:hypothetical protein
VGDVGGDEGDVGGDEGDMVTFVHNGFTARSTMPLAEGDRVKWYNNQVRARGGREEGERMARGGEEHNIYPSSFPCALYIPLFLPLCTIYTPLPSLCALYIPLFLLYLYTPLPSLVHYIYPPLPQTMSLVSTGLVLRVLNATTIHFDTSVSKIGLGISVVAEFPDHANAGWSVVSALHSIRATFHPQAQHRGHSFFPLLLHTHSFLFYCTLPRVFTPSPARFSFLRLLPAGEWSPSVASVFSLYTFTDLSLSTLCTWILSTRYLCRVGRVNLSTIP